MSKVYGKALGAFRKINSIRSSMSKVDEYRSELNNKRMKAESDAREAMALKNAIGKTISAGVAIGGGALQHFNDNINPESIKNWSSGLDMAGQAINQFAVPTSNDDSKRFLSSGMQSQISEQDSFSNIVKSGIDQYSLQEQVSQNVKARDFKEGFDKLKQSNPNTIDNSFAGYAKDNQEWRKGEGYSIDEVGTLRDYALNRKNAGLLDPSLNIENSNKDELINAINYLKIGKKSNQAGFNNPNYGIENIEEILKGTAGY